MIGTLKTKVSHRCILSFFFEFNLFLRFFLNYFSHSVMLYQIERPSITDSICQGSTYIVSLHQSHNAIPTSLSYIFIHFIQNSFPDMSRTFCPGTYGMFIFILFNVRKYMCNNINCPSISNSFIPLSIWDSFCVIIRKCLESFRLNAG